MNRLVNFGNIKVEGRDPSVVLSELITALQKEFDYLEKNVLSKGDGLKSGTIDNTRTATVQNGLITSIE